MPTSESLLNALKQDDIYYLTPGSVTDYGFVNVSDKNVHHLFGAYHAIAKFMSDTEFVNKMHQAYLDKNLHETVDKLTKTLPDLFQNHWNNFILNDGKISPLYI
jgi:hypothetical protein